MDLPPMLVSATHFTMWLYGFMFAGINVRGANMTANINIKWNIYSMCQYVSVCVSMCQYVSVYVSICQYVSVCVSICQYVSVCVSMCQYMSVCVSMCQYVSVCVSYDQGTFLSGVPFSHFPDLKWLLANKYEQLSMKLENSIILLTDHPLFGENQFKYK